jgi:hypothetical protein
MVTKNLISRFAFAVGRFRTIGVALAGGLAGLAGMAVNTYAQAPATIVSFDVPGAKFTSPASINKKGDIVGWWSSVGYGEQEQGFVRDRCGKIASFAVPDSIATDPLSINDRGEIVGDWFPRAGGPPTDFVRHDDGSFTYFNVPGTGSTYVVSINDKGEIFGSWGNVDGTTGGFVRRKDGDFETFIIPGATFFILDQINNRGALVLGRRAWIQLSSMVLCEAATVRLLPSMCRVR